SQPTTRQVHLIGPPGTAAEKLGRSPGDHRYSSGWSEPRSPGDHTSGRSHGSQRSPGDHTHSQEATVPGGPCRRERALGPPEATDTSLGKTTLGPGGPACTGRASVPRGPYCPEGAVNYARSVCRRPEPQGR